MNKWLLLYDDGKTPAVHHKEVEAETMSEALETSELPLNSIWGCAMKGHVSTVGYFLLALTGHSPKTIEAALGGSSRPCRRRRRFRFHTLPNLNKPGG